VSTLVRSAADILADLYQAGAVESYDHDPLLSTAQAAQHLGVSCDRVRRLADLGRLDAVRPGSGGHRHYRTSDVAALKAAGGYLSNRPNAPAESVAARGGEEPGRVFAHGPG
jgi:excisionase family DNA binding protein